ncbi:calcium-binding protein [Sphingomonas sp. LM7]|uniref:calcium-binding protein n=1 Tax=Sphingomonas sp. LM7 TaxID=1938607 RepID=UPI000983EF61|nr:calcium-binding protein [Sphingomonas sp. LM7]AQR72373.1 hypothetical protein BXU08_00650 [Sphingomonas sp. LM7]
MAVITGNTFDNSLAGTAADDDISALGGNDIVRGGGGNDLINGGEGADDLQGEAGNDIVHGGNGDDSLGEYYQEGVGGSDELYGDAGNDQIIYFNTLPNSATHSLLDGGSGEDVLRFVGNITLFGSGSGSVEMVGGADNDRFVTSGGAAVTIDAGTGDDFVQLAHWGTQYEIALGAGSDIVSVVTSAAISIPAIVITDFAAGDAGDALALSSFLSERFNLAPNANPFTNGRLNLVQRGADAVLQANGLTQSGGLVDFIILKNVLASTLTAHNLGGYSQDGSAAAVVSFTGTAAADNRNGNSGNDLLQGLGGADWLYGGAGNDRIEGGDGNDKLVGDLGDDLIYGGTGDDEIISQYGVDKIFGEGGRDHISVELSWSAIPNLGIEVDGGDDDDFLHFSDLMELSTATIVGGSGNDAISTNGGLAVEIDAGSGDDMVQVVMFSGTTNITLGTGGDRLDLLGSTGFTGQERSFTVEDFAVGNSGDTMKFYFMYAIADNWSDGANPFSAKYLRLAQSGNDTLLLLDSRGEGKFFSLLGRFENVTASQLNLFNLGFAPGQIAVAGGIGADAIYGSFGADQLMGMAGNDTLTGGGGLDQLWGGTGDDTYFVDGDDLVFEGAGEGFDTVYTSASFNLTAGSRVEVVGTANWRLTDALRIAGNEFNNAIIANSGNNTLYGGGGDDSIRGLDGNDFIDGQSGTDFLIGGLGNDTYFVDGLDTVEEAAGEGYDTVYAHTSYTLVASSEVEMLATVDYRLTTTMSLSGNQLNNNIVGNNGNNILDGRAGDDSILGLAGNDILIGGGGVDYMIGGEGDDIYYVTSGDTAEEAAGQGYDAAYAETSFVLTGGSAVELLGTLDYRKTDALDLTGNDLDQSIVGNNGANTLRGLGGTDSLNGLDGADVIDGGAGQDMLTGGAGADVFRFSAAAHSSAGAADRIADFATGLDKIDLSAIDARPGTAGDDAFAFIGSEAFSGVAGQLRVHVSGGDAHIYGDLDGNGVADFEIVINGSAPAATDFFF